MTPRFLLLLLLLLPSISACRLVISELNSLYPGVSWLGKGGETFVELEWVECGDDDVLNVQDYALVVVETYVRGKARPGSMGMFRFYGSRMMEKVAGERVAPPKAKRQKLDECPAENNVKRVRCTPKNCVTYFVVGNQNPDQNAAIQFDISLSTKRPSLKASVWPASFNRDAGISQFFGSNDADAQKEHGVAFILVKAPKPNDKDFTELLLQFAITQKNKDIDYKHDVPLLTIPDDGDVDGDNDFKTFFSSIMDVVIVARSTSIIAGNSFLKALYRQRNDMPSHIWKLPDVPGNDDIPSGRSLSRCGSVWKMTAETIAAANDCTSSFALPLLAFICTDSPMYQLSYQDAANDYSSVNWSQYVTLPNAPAPACPADDDEVRTYEAEGGNGEGAVVIEAEIRTSTTTTTTAAPPLARNDNEPFFGTDLQLPAVPLDPEIKDHFMQTILSHSLATNDILRKQTAQIAELHALFQTTLGKDATLQQGINLGIAAKTQQDYEEKGKLIGRDERLTLLALPNVFTPAQVTKFQTDAFDFFTLSDSQKVEFMCVLCKYTRALSDKTKDAGRALLKLLAGHADTGGHISAKAAVLNAIEESVRKRFAIVSHVDGSENAITERVFSLIYAENHFYIPPERHAGWSSFLSQNGWNLGSKLASSWGNSLVTKYLSDDLQMKLHNFLRVSNTDFSLLLDSSTDKAGRNILLLYIRFVEKTHPVTHFFAAIEVTVSETGENVKELVVSFFKNADLYEILLNRLVAIGSDGASNMSKDNGFQGRMKKHINEERAKKGEANREIIWVHCFAHRLNLAISDGLIDTLLANSKLWHSFATSFLNSLKSFFGPTASKRLKVLKEYTVERGERYFSLKGYIAIRWTASVVSAIKSLIKMYPNILGALEKMIADPEFKKDKDAIAKVKTYIFLMRDLRLYQYLTWQAEVLEHVATVSKKMQSSEGSIFAMEKATNFLKVKLEELADNPYAGKYINETLEKLECRAKGDEDWLNGLHPTCHSAFWQGWSDKGPDSIAFQFKADGTEKPQAFRDPYTLAKDRNADSEMKALLTEYWVKYNAQVQSKEIYSEEALKVHETIGHVKLINTFTEAAFVFLNKEVRTEMIDLMNRKIAARFTYSGVMEGSRYFMPSKVLDKDSITSAVAILARKEMFQFLGLDVVKAETQYVRLSHSLITTLEKGNEYANYLKQLREEFEQFFHHVLSKKDSFPVGEELKRVYKFILTLPMNTAEVERGFSTLFFIRSSRAASIDISTLDQRMRIVINGPPPTRYDVSDAVKKWIADNHMRADNPAIRRGRCKTYANMEDDDSDGSNDECDSTVPPKYKEFDRKAHLIDFYSPHVRPNQ